MPTASPDLGIPRTVKLPPPTSRRERFLSANPLLLSEKAPLGAAVDLLAPLRPHSWRSNTGGKLPYAAPTRWYSGKRTTKVNYDYASRVREKIEQHAGFSFSMDGNPITGLAFTEPVIGKGILATCTALASLLTGDATKNAPVPLSLLNERCDSLHRSLELPQNAFDIATRRELPLLRIYLKNGTKYVTFNGQALFVLIRSGFDFGGNETLTRLMAIAPELILEDLRSAIEREPVPPSSVRRFVERISLLYHRKKSPTKPETKLPDDSRCNKIFLKAAEVWVTDFKRSELKVMDATASLLLSEEQARYVRLNRQNHRPKASAFEGGGGFGNLTLPRSSCVGSQFT